MIPPRRSPAADVCAAILSVAGIVAFLPTLKSAPHATRLAHGLLATLTIFVSWLLVPTIFTVHYADLFYSAEERRQPLVFPRTPEPVFWDFAYFSLTIAVACQTADVSTSDGDIRRVVVAHSIISFLFNVAILGFRNQRDCRAAGLTGPPDTQGFGSVSARSWRACACAVS